MLEGENNSLQFYIFCLEADFKIKYQDQDQGQNFFFLSWHAAKSFIKRT